MRLTEIKAKGCEPRYEYQDIGYYARDFKQLINALLTREVMESDVEDFKKVVTIIEGHITSINYNQIIKGFMDQIQDLKDEVAILKKKGKPNEQ